MTEADISCTTLNLSLEKSKCCHILGFRSTFPKINLFEFIEIQDLVFFFNKSNFSYQLEQYHVYILLNHYYMYLYNTVLYLEHVLDR